MKLALAQLGSRPPKRILDAGCGRADHTFYLAGAFPESQVVGLDISAAQIAANRALANKMRVSNVEFLAMDLRDFKASKEFDLIICVDVLEHIVERQAVLGQLADALTAGGHLFAHMPLRRPVPVPLSRFLRAFHAWAEEEHVADELTFNQFVAHFGKLPVDVCQARETFGYWTGELATSLFAIPYRNTPGSRLAQLVIAPFARLLAMADTLPQNSPRFAAAITCRRGA